MAVLDQHQCKTGQGVGQVGKENHYGDQQAPTQTLFRELPCPSGVTAQQRDRKGGQDEVEEADWDSHGSRQDRVVCHHDNASVASACDAGAGGLVGCHDNTWMRIRLT